MTESIEALQKVFSEAGSKIEQTITALEQKRHDLESRFKEALAKDQSSQVDLEYLQPFLEEPYVMIPKHGQEWWVLVPKWLKLQVGYLDHSTQSYNVFIVNKYVKWLSEVPPELEDKLKFPDALPLKVFDGMLLTGEQLQERAWQKYSQFLSRREGKDRIRIKAGYEFKLIAQMIEDGTLPFMPKPVAPEDLRPWSDSGSVKYAELCKSKNIAELQDRAWNEFLQHGAIGLYWSFGTGKSLFGHRIIGSLKGPHLVVVPSIILKEQWLERLSVFNPQAKAEVTVETYHAYDKVAKKQWNTVIWDESQHLPATTFIKLSTIQAKYRLGFSGSPFREDGRENYIFALTGFPIGMSWAELLKLRILNVPQFRVYVLPDRKSKDRKLDELMRLPLKTIIFCDSLDYGEEISKRFEIPFVYGVTQERLDIIRSSQACVVSRVGDEGLSDLKLERIIEVSYLFGSRMQESQRFGRLMHSERKTQHIILMTRAEYDAYQKRLLAITQRGFKLELIEEAA